MDIELSNAGKRFRLEWIFRGINFTFRPSERYAVLGPNGAGKSTLLKVLAGQLSLSKGNIRFLQHGKALEPERVFQHIAYAAPYIELIEEFTLEEAILFHARMKPLADHMTPAQWYERIELPRSRKKEIRFFSSGMKQRVKLALAICSDTPILLLDEPTTNLDQHACAWYKNLLESYASDRLVIIASNDPADVEQCGARLNVTDFK